MGRLYPFRYFPGYTWSILPLSWITNYCTTLLPLGGALHLCSIDTILSIVVVEAGPTSECRHNTAHTTFQYPFLSPSDQIKADVGEGVEYLQRIDRNGHRTSAPTKACPIPPSDILKFLANLPMVFSSSSPQCSTSKTVSFGVVFPAFHSPVGRLKAFTPPRLPSTCQAF